MLTRLRRLLLRTKVRYATYAIPPKCLRRWLGSQHISHSIFILAHPDDEIFCAGLICELRRRQIPIGLVFLTRGEGACQPDLPSDEIAKLRTGEAKRSASLLGVDAVTFLDLPDKPQVQRANMAIMTSVMGTSVLTYTLIVGDVDPKTINRIILYTIPYILSVWFGMKLFSNMPGESFKTIILWLLLIIVSGILIV